jgi:hypothetical protein
MHDIYQCNCHVMNILSKETHCCKFQSNGCRVYPLLVLSLLAFRLTVTMLITTELSAETKYPIKFKLLNFF